MSSTSHVEVCSLSCTSFVRTYADLRDHLRPPNVWLSIILRELLQAIAIFEEAMSYGYNPLWLDWIDAVLREVAEGV